METIIRSVGVLIAPLIVSGLISATTQASHATATPPVVDPLQSAQSAIEIEYSAGVTSKHLRSWLRELSAQPHHAGSEGSERVANYIADQFRTWGFEVEIETFYVLMSTPNTISVEMLAPARFRAAFKEKSYPGYTTEPTTNALPPYSAYSADGKVTANVVYVNYGTAEDYAYLTRQGIDLKGKIALGRFGKVLRGNKPKLAAEHGAIGMILYSDPSDYGHYQGTVFPEGRFLPASGYQLGSMLDLPRLAGDPLTPGTGAPPKPVKFAVEDGMEYLSPIPVLPLSADDALPIITALGGPMAPESWQGALGTPYRIGAKAVTLRMQVEQDWQLVPLHNVVARLHGCVYPDEWVIRGNNHDAWIYGAEDPLSGLVALLEEARGIAKLVKGGWCPGRTLIYAAWDGEELGLMGATEWAETHAAILQEKAVLYLNTGPTTPGYFGAGGSHSLESLVDRVSRTVADPVHGVSIHQRRVQLQQHADTAPYISADRLLLDPLGLSSDYTPFLQHLGVPSLYIGFEGEADGGVYHSRYDNFAFYDQLGQRAYDYLAALAETAGKIMLRVADAEILPFNAADLSATLHRYLHDIVTSLPPASECQALATGSCPAMAEDLDTLRSALTRLDNVAIRFTEVRSRREPGPLPSDLAQIGEINRLLYQAEQAFLSAEGLPGRPWYRHQIYAPDLDSGYAPITLPGIREAIEAKNRTLLIEQVESVTAAVNKYAGIIETGVAKLERQNIQK